MTSRSSRRLHIYYETLPYSHKDTQGEKPVRGVNDDKKGMRDELFILHVAGVNEQSEMRAVSGG